MILWHFICPAYYIGKPYYFFILFHFKTIKTICHLVNTNILSFLDQSVSCLCCNGSLTLFFLQDRQERLWSGAKLFHYNKQATLWARNDKMLLCAVMISWHVSHDVKKPYRTYNFENITVKFQFFQNEQLMDWKHSCYIFSSTDLWPFCSIFGFFFYNYFDFDQYLLSKTLHWKNSDGFNLKSPFIEKILLSLSENEGITCQLFRNS